MNTEQTELVLGRGEVFFSPVQSDPLQGQHERYIGNTTTFQINRKVSRISKKTSYFGKVHESGGIITGEDVEVKFITDHISLENIGMWFGDEVGREPLTGDDLALYSETFRAKKGAYYQLGNTLDPFGARFIEGLVITRYGNVMTRNADYRADMPAGRIYIMPEGRILDNQTIIVNFNKRPSTSLVRETNGQEQRGSLRYVAKNVYGRRVDYYFPQVRITPSGGMDLKGDEFQQMAFEVVVERKSPIFSLLYATRLGQAPIPITADSTLFTADTDSLRTDIGTYSAT